jgi:transposase InsO family protein
MATIGRDLVEAHLREGRSVGELAAAHGVHRSWLYKLLGRYRREGEPGLLARSRRPRRSPSALSPALRRQILELRRRLVARGLDGGAVTIHWRLERRGRAAPSVSTIWRLLRREGLVTPQPRKRPRSSLIRFVASLPNECWQADMTHWTIAAGREVEIVNVIDDHSRLCVAAAAFAVTRAIDTAEVFAAARRRYGTPQALLTDNGCIFTAEHRGGKVVLQTELGRWGCSTSMPGPITPRPAARWSASIRR